MDAALITSIASAVVAAIAGLSAWASQRAAAKASIRNTDTTSRSAIEEGAFERAKSFYTDTIDRQDREIHELEGDVGRLKTQVREQAEQIEQQGEEIQALRAELTTAKNALRLAFPDEH